MKSKKNNKNSIEITEKEVQEEQLVEPPIEPTTETPKPKRVLSESQLQNLAKARERAAERKKELKELNEKSKGLKEERLKDDAKEYDKLKKKKELDDTIKKIEVPTPEKKKKIKKIIYESDTDEESVEEVIVKRKKPKDKKEKIEPSYEQLANMSVEQQIKNKLQQEKITCFFNQLTGKNKF